MMPTLLPESRVDTVASLPDRCDGCGAAARLGVRLTAGGELFFCGHHANRLAADIARIAVRISVEEGFAWTGLPSA